MTGHSRKFMKEKKEEDDLVLQGNLHLVSSSPIICLVARQAFIIYLLPY